MEGRSKNIVKVYTGNQGLPKGSNSQGNRVYSSTRCPQSFKDSVLYCRFNRRIRGSITGLLYIQTRSYSSVENINISSRWDKIVFEAKKHPKGVIDRSLYSFMLDKEVLLFAYNNLKSKPGSMTPGLAPSTLDGISNEFLDSLILKLKSNKFEFRPARRISIPKPGGGTRPLTIASPSDKIVLEAMCTILDPIFEPTFNDCSHGFRPKLGCHTALRYIEDNFKSSKWIIEGDIHKYFDCVDHKILRKLLKNRIVDQRMLCLIDKALKVGYGEFGGPVKDNIVGTPQGSTLSPLLSNIYLNEFDKFVMELKIKFDKGDKPIVNKEYKRVSGLLLRNPIKAEALSITKKTLIYIPYNLAIDPDFKRLVYVRYVDD